MPSEECCYEHGLARQKNQGAPARRGTQTNTYVASAAGRPNRYRLLQPHEEHTTECCIFLLRTLRLTRELKVNSVAVRPPTTRSGHPVRREPVFLEQTCSSPCVLNVVGSATIALKRALGPHRCHSRSSGWLGSLPCASTEKRHQHQDDAPPDMSQSLSPRAPGARHGCHPSSSCRQDWQETPPLHLRSP